MAFHAKSSPIAQFVALFMKELYWLLRIKVALSTAYHPQTDRQTEQVNQELEQYLRIFVGEWKDDWYNLLPLAEFSYNNHIHLSTQQTPFLLDTSRHPWMDFEPHQPVSRVEAVNEFTDRMKSMLEEAKAAKAKAKDDMACYYNHRCTPAPIFAPSDKVYLDAANIHTTCPSTKLSHRRLSPLPGQKTYQNTRLPPDPAYFYEATSPGLQRSQTDGGPDGTDPRQTPASTTAARARRW